MADSIASLHIALRATAANLAGDINRGLASARGATGTGAIALGNVLADGITAGLKGIGGAITDALSKAVNMAASFETTQTQFKVLLGDMDQANKMLSSFRQLDQNSPLSFGDLTEAGKTLLAFGASANSIVPTLKTLGDVSLGNGERFKSLALAFGQVQASGRLMGQEVLQFVNAGFNPLQQIAQRTGESMGDLKKRMEDGKVSFAEVKQAFTDATAEGGRFFGAMDAGGKTFEGVMAKVKGAADQAFIQVGTQLKDAILPILKQIGPLIDAMVPSMVAVAQSTGEWLASLLKAQGGAEGIAGKVKEIGTQVMEAARWVGNLGEKFQVVFGYVKLGADAVGLAFGEIGRLGAAAALTIQAGFKVLWEWMSLKIQEIANGIVAMADRVNAAVTSVKSVADKIFNPAAKSSYWDFQMDSAPDVAAPATPLPFDLAKSQKNLDDATQAYKLTTEASADALIDARIKATSDIIASGNRANAALAAANAGGPGAGDRFVDNLNSRLEAAKYPKPDLSFSGADFTKPPAAKEPFRMVPAYDSGFRMKGADGTATAVKGEENLTKVINAETAKRAKLMQGNSAVMQQLRAQDAANATAAGTARMAEAVLGDQKIAESAVDAGRKISSTWSNTYSQVNQLTQNTITSSVTAWITGTGKISDIVSQWANQMIQQFVQVALWGNKAAVGGGGGAGGGWGGIVSSLFSGGGSWLTSLFGGAYAEGGRPPMGKVSVVGERGPELFIPDSRGTIVPNHKMNAVSRSSGGGGASGGGGTMEAPIIINQNFTAGITRAELAGAMDTMMDQTRAGVVDAISKGGSYRKKVQS